MSGAPPAGAREGTVLVVGVGGLGTPCAWALADAGVLRLVLVDPDRIEPSNLPRQLLFRPEDVGRRKAVVAAERLAREGLSLDARVERFDRATAPSLLATADVVVDATDGAASKDLVHALAVRAGLPVVHAAALGHEGRLLDVPAGGRPCVACLFGVGGGEAGDTCARFGVVPSITAAVGFLAAHVALERHARPRAPSRGLRVLDGGAGRALTLDAVADPRCPVCGAPPDAPLPALADPAPCGDGGDGGDVPRPDAPGIHASGGVLDLRDEACPMNLLRARRALDRAAPGEVVELWLGAEGIATVPDGLAHLGHAILSRAPIGGALALRVRRGAGARAPVGSDAWLRRFARQIVLPEVGEEGQRRLADASVEVGGAGDAFVAAAWVLACAGVGTVRLRGGAPRLEAARARAHPFVPADAGRSEAEALADALTRHGIAGAAVVAAADGTALRAARTLRIDVGDGVPSEAACRSRGALALAEGALAADRALRRCYGLEPAAAFQVRDDATIVATGGDPSAA